ncbi:MAG: phosphoenolpyruvate mutase [Nitrospinae bacterium CG11_big_fil_rev_8_21_14_0_20_45_15]|nr:MAG: phosphoenolpyruvate mutase [Nitrospinae bacterium CG11_big_fil_rev_8_21_14_0_20_45_15]
MTLLNNTLPEQRRGKLKSLLKQRALVRVLEAHNGLSGILANNVYVEGQTENGTIRHEYDAIWESSLTDSASKGHPDIEVISFDSRLATISEILAVTNKPMIVDGDTGGDPNNFEYMVSKLERAGVSAVIIEDKVFPKRNSLETGAQQTLEDPQVFAQKIKRGKNICMTNDFLIIARIESLIAGKDMDTAVQRAKIYLSAGVDGIMIHSKSKQPNEVLEFAKRYKALPENLTKGKPLVCVPTTYNTITEDELAKAGFNIVIHANHLLRSAYKAMEETAKIILSNQRSFEADPHCALVRDIFSTVGFLDVKKKDEENELTTNIPTIIPAAGEDPTLKAELNGKPKAMLEIGGKTLLQRQIEALNHNDLTDITVVTGYAADQMKAEGVTFVENKNYRNGTSLQSILTAKNKIQHGWLMLYADIVLQDNILPKILECKEDIVLVVDSAPQYHPGDKRTTLDYVISKHKAKPARRKISFVHENIIAKIGNKINPETATHEFIGLAKFSKTGAEQFLQTYQDCIQNYKGKFQEADDITRFNFTDLIQEMIDRGFTVNFVEIQQGWLEIHQPEDIELANKLFQQSASELIQTH